MPRLRLYSSNNPDLTMSRCSLITLVLLGLIVGCAPKQTPDVAPPANAAYQSLGPKGSITTTAEQDRRIDELSDELYRKMQEFVYVFNEVEEPGQSVALPSTALGVPDTSIAAVYLDHSGRYAATTRLKWTNYIRGGGLMFKMQLIHVDNVWHPTQVHAVTAWIGNNRTPLRSGAPSQENQIKRHLERFFELSVQD